MQRPSLDELLRQSIEAVAQMSDLERARMYWDQRISFVYGQMMDCAPHITRDQIEAEAIRVYGPRP